MSKFVPDILSKRWVIISSSRSSRPDEFNQKKAGKKCPFCEGNESLAADELYRVGKGEPGQPGWEVRVVTNKYPITDYHEVIVHSPDDEKGLHEQSLDEVKKVIQVYKDRFNVNQKNGQVLIFCNHGEDSGASLSHPHSQLVVIPKQINLDTLKKEAVNNLVTKTKHFEVYCPDFSQWPYEVWISPLTEGKMFGDITEDELADLSEVLQKVLKRLQEIHKLGELTKKEFSYNFYIHPKENWYLRIIPRFVGRAGFELGTGLSVNEIDPVEASRQIRGVESHMNKVMSKLEKWE